MTLTIPASAVLAVLIAIKTGIVTIKIFDSLLNHLLVSQAHLRSML
jgi:hypothetical protein